MSTNAVMGGSGRTRSDWAGQGERVGRTRVLHGVKSSMTALVLNV